MRWLGLRVLIKIVRLLGAVDGFSMFQPKSRIEGCHTVNSPFTLHTLILFYHRLLLFLAIRIFAAIASASSQSSVCACHHKLSNVVRDKDK